MITRYLICLWLCENKLWPNRLFAWCLFTQPQEVAYISTFNPHQKQWNNIVIFLVSLGWFPWCPPSAATSMYGHTIHIQVWRVSAQSVPESFNEHPCNEAWGPPPPLPSEQPLHSDNKAVSTANSACGGASLSLRRRWKEVLQLGPVPQPPPERQPANNKRVAVSLCVRQSAGVRWTDSLTLLNLCVCLGPLVQ